uniref:Uncharacterized protein n=1 Tax=Candidatus Kentrum sp. LFY TaxID=2126342 RepID=A0A450U8E0_9GAMM|nr:MAG: hypothetical protein BECKLFY1418B_GA0070995_100943 [Candidatus Kentron sp. LFY]
MKVRRIGSSKYIEITIPKNLAISGIILFIPRSASLMNQVSQNTNFALLIPNHASPVRGEASLVFFHLFLDRFLLGILISLWFFLAGLSHFECTIQDESTKKHHDNEKRNCLH